MRTPTFTSSPAEMATLQSVAPRFLASVTISSARSLRSLRFIIVSPLPWLCRAGAEAEAAEQTPHRATERIGTACDWFAAGTADGDFLDADRRHADAHRNTLAVLAAGADALIEAEVVADHAD